MKRVFVIGILASAMLSAREEQTGPWNMAALLKVPPATWGARRVPVFAVN